MSTARTGYEAEHQRALFVWANTARRVHPDLRWLHSSQSGMRAASPKTAALQSAAGMRKGVPDIFLDVPRGRWHGLRIELKRPGRHSVTREQREWIAGYNERGYMAVVAVGWDEARKVIVDYLETSE